MGFLDWRGWDRFDRLDERVGFRRDRSPRERAEGLRRVRLVFSVLGVILAVVDLAIGAWVRGAITLIAAAVLWVVVGRVARRLETGA
jgi:hypothetical protein